MEEGKFTPEQLENIVDLWRWVTGILGVGLVGAGTLITYLWFLRENSLKTDKAKVELQIEELNRTINAKNEEIKQLNAEIKQSIIPVLTIVEQTLDRIIRNK